jgi:hypothetical protein
MIWRMATPFDTDYSFLNLPGAGSDVRGPIELPSFQPKDSSFNLEKYAPRQLQNQRLVQPSLAPLSDLDSQNVLSSARPFEDIQSLGATFGQRLAETERFFGDRVNKLQGSIEQLTGEKDKLGQDLEAAFLQQDEMSQQAIEEQIAALDAQRAELVAQLESSVAEAEANGVDAVQAAEQVAAEQKQQFEGQIQEIEAAQQQAIAERDQAIAEQDNIRAQAAENQVQALEGMKQQMLEERSGIVSGLEGEIGSLQGEIDNLTGARDSALSERDQAIAAQDTIRAEAADQQAQALQAQAGDYQAQLDQLTGQSTQYQGQVGERDQTIADLQSQIQALQATPATVATPTPSPITTPIDVKPIIDPNTGEEMTADRLQNLKPTIFGTPILEGADFSNMPVYTPPTASSMPTFIPQSVRDAVGNVPAPGPVFPPAELSQKPTGQVEEFTITDMLMRNPDGSPMMGSGPGMNFGDMGMPSNKELLNPPPQQFRPDKLRPPLTKPNLPALKPIAKPTPSLLAPKPIASPIQRMLQMRMGDKQPRQRMNYGGEMKGYAEGDEVFMPSNPNQIAFSIETEIKNLMNEYEMAANNGEIERAQMVAKQINELEARRIKMMNEAKAMESGRTISDMDRQQTGRTISDLGRGRTISDLDRGRTKSDMDRQIGMMYGGEMKRYANGGEIENMLSGMDSGEQEAMGELEQMAPEMEMIDQLVNMVVQMIQQGAGEEQVISFLREQGLDDEDIGTVLQLVAEMAETEEVAAQNEIGADLEQLG